MNLDPAYSSPRRFWIDGDDAPALIERADVPDSIKQYALELRETGVAVIRGAVAPALCRRVVEDYRRWSTQNADYVRANLAVDGREKRLVNFHLWSTASAAVGANPLVMEFLDFIFAGTASVYTSLTFKYGSQQPVHRDTPHFATWPRRMFVGAWTALEDVHPKAGPLFYHPGAHRAVIDPLPFMHEARERLPQAPTKEQLDLALDLYNGEVITRSPQIAAPQLLDMAMGDTVIWHPDLPHGGSPAEDVSLTRWSVVFHCAPVDVQVHQHERFFLHRGDTPPPDRYGYIDALTRKVAVAGEVAFM